MINNFFTPEEIKPRKKSPYKLQITEGYDFALLHQDLFQIVSPHVESISDRKHKIISWLKKTTLIQRMSILTYTNKEFVCMIRAMYEKKQSEYLDHSSTAFTISHIEQTYPFMNNPSDQYDLLSMVNNKKLSEEYLATQDVIMFLKQQLLANIQIMSRYTQFDSMTFNQACMRNVDEVFHWFQILGNGIAYELTIQHYEKLKLKPNSVMFYDPSEGHCYKKASLGTWITQVFMKHISMKYLEYELVNPINSYNDLKQKSKEFQKYWKIITPERKNTIIKKVLEMKPIELYQEHRSMIKVTRNGFPPILKSDKVPFLLKSIVNANDKQIFGILSYTNINQTLESHSVLKFYITLELQDEIKKYNEFQNSLIKMNKMKKKPKQIKSQNVELLAKNKQISEGLKHIRYKEAKEQPKQSKEKRYEQKFIVNEGCMVIERHATQKQKKYWQKKEQNYGKEGQKIIVKGTDLFYKKLEVSQTQHIVSIEANSAIFSLKDSQNPSILVSAKETKLKKNKKNKKKQKADNTEQTEIQDHIQKPSNLPHDSNETSALSIETSLQQKALLRKSSSKLLDRNSQNSSETTNDQTDASKEEKTQFDVKIQQKEAEKKNADPLDVIFKNLQRKINFYNKQRKLVINRLMHVFGQQKLSFKVYGSCSCDAAVPTSDIDIVVDPSIVDYFFFSYANYKKKIINSLEYLQKVFEKLEWTGDFMLLPGANIPLLTFVKHFIMQTVNPGIQFDSEQGNHLYNNRKELKQEIKISVDITIEPYVNMIDEVPMHLGVESSELIKEWISIFPFYLNLLLLLKLFSKNQNLNKSYHGGISSFMQAVILANFYKNLAIDINVPITDIYSKKEKLSELMPSKWNLSIMFLLYCKFIMEFDEENEILDVNSDRKRCLKQTGMAKEQFCMINPLTGKMMSERCTLFPLYKKVLSEIHDRMETKDQAQIDQYLRIVFEA